MLSKGSMTVARGDLCCTQYKTHLKVCFGELYAVEKRSSPNLCYRRLGHMREKGIKLLASKAVILVDTSTSFNPCDHCWLARNIELFLGMFFLSLTT